MSKFIIEFQKNNGLTPDGKIGKKTLLKIKDKYNIPTIEALAHFMGNVSHECAEFTVFKENLNYSANGLLKIFPKYFKTLEIAKQYARKPERIANRVYANRMGNGNEASGDGWKYSGKGALQTTGKNNFKLLGDFLKVDLLKNPELVETTYALESAIFYFNSNKLWSIASRVDDLTIRRIRIRVNGGIIGLEDVTKKVKEYYKILTT
jgi:putative chitinase